MNIRSNFKILYKLFSLKSMIALTSRKLILPFYHTISNETLPHISHLYPLKTQKQFEDDLTYLCQYFTPISIDDLSDIVANQKDIDKPCFHLTFDDGLKEIYTTIAPVLEKRGIPATIFINTDFLDNKNLFYRYKISLIIEALNSKSEKVQEIATLLDTKDHHHLVIKKKLLSLNHKQIELIDKIAAILDIDFNEFLATQKPYLTTPQVEDLIDKGFNIGSHSVDHPLFKDIEFEAQKQQIKASFELLENKFNIKNKYFSFPFTDDGVKADFFNWMYEKNDLKLSFGISGMKDDLYKTHLHRIPFENNEEKAEDIIKGEYFYFMLKHFLGKNKINRK